VTYTLLGWFDNIVPAAQVRIAQLGVAPANLTTSTTKPVIKEVSWSMVGVEAEVSLALA
jgi:hypothetical protein